MADVEFTQDVTGTPVDAPQSNGLGAVATVIGALCSAALVIGIGVWGYKLVVRDVTGIPVVKAVDGPMRVQPDNPGGDLADHQGLAVNAVAADGSAAPPPDRLVLAPRPVSLTDEDVPGAQLVRPAMRPVMPDLDAAPPPEEPVEDTPATAETTGEGLDIDALVAEITASVEPLTFESAEEAPAARRDGEETDLLDLAAATTAPVASEPVQPTVARDVPGVAVSLRPQKRPAGLRDAPVVVAANVDNPASDGLDIDPADVPAGTRVVQLGAFPSADLARGEWERLATQFGDYMQDKRRIVQEASSGGRAFYRLRAHGFDDLSDARRFCSALVAEGADCIPVVTR